MTQSRDSPTSPPPPLSPERDQSHLWRWFLSLMVLLAIAFAALDWRQLASLPYYFGPIALGMLFFSLFLATYAYSQRQEALALRRVARDLQEQVIERRKLEKQLLQQEEFRRSLIESFPDLILVFDMQERHTFVNSRVRGLLGLEPQELIGKTISEAQPHSPELLELYRSVVAGENFAAMEYSARHRDGSLCSMRASASQFFDTDSRMAGVIISVRDISTEKKFEQQVVQSERLAAMGAMIGGVAHELNNPLTSILGFSELLLDGQTTDSSRKQVVMLQQQARRATEIVRNLTYFATPPAPGRTRIQIGDVLERTLNLHAYSLRKNSITVDFVLHPNLPSVLGDAHQLMQVFLNLILNAEQSMREARGRGTLRIRLANSREFLRVQFADDGPGVPPEIVASIFDPFYTTKRPGRTGLGLSICKSVIKEHQGTIEAANAPEGGAVFTVTLPVFAAS